MYGYLPYVKLWRTTDGGDGALPKDYVPSFVTDTVPRVKMCNSARGFIKVLSNNCSRGWAFESAILSGDTTHFTLDSVPVFPEYLGGLTSDSFYVRFQPLTQAGTFTSSVHLHLISLDSTVTFDTTIEINATSIPVPPDLSYSTSSLDFGSLSTCNGVGDTSITFSDAGCGPDTITAATLTGAGFSWVNDSLPIVVPPGDSVTFGYRFIPPDSGAFSGIAKLHVTSMGLTENPQISLTGRGVQGVGVLDVRSTSLQAGSFSFCAGDTVLSDTIRNTGCDTLVISNLRFSQDGAWSSASSLRPDSLLLPGASAVFQFTFAPRVKGAHSATLSFHSRNIVHDPGHDTTVTISGIGLPGTTALSADTAPRDFGALFECESRDTIIWLRNPGCDTLRVDSAEFSAFSNGSYQSDLTHASYIAPDSSLPITIHLTGSSGSMDDSVTFYSDANSGSQSKTVPLLATSIPPARLRLVVSPSDSTSGGLKITCYVMLEGQIPAGLISALHFDITHNDDLLSFLKASGAGLTIVNTSPKSGIVTQSFTLSPIPNLVTIGMLKFQVYLADSTSTPIALSNISFTTSLDLPLDCIASIADTGAQFTYVYRCGDHTLQNFMLTGGMPFSIESIVPNPAQSEIEVRVEGGALATLTCELYDALGNRVLLQPLDHPPAPSYSASLRRRGSIDVSSLPSGTYFLRLSQNGYVQSRQISIEH